jgi:hypothetical protein
MYLSNEIIPWYVHSAEEAFVIVLLNTLLIVRCVPFELTSRFSNQGKISDKNGNGHL